MAKKSLSWSFQKVEIFLDNDEIIAVEKGKDEEKSYNLTNILKSLEGQDGLSIKIGYDNDIPSE